MQDARLVTIERDSLRTTCAVVALAVCFTGYGGSSHAQKGTAEWFGVPVPGHRQDVGGPSSRYVPLPISGLTLQIDASEGENRILDGEHIAG